MPGSAQLDEEVLVDGLVEMIDELRGDLHPGFGVRAYRVFVIRRTWSGDEIGEGDYTDVEMEIDPQPKVWNFGKDEQNPGGTNERGEVKITEVSLTYTEAELFGDRLGPSDEWLFRIEDAHGQGSVPRMCKRSRPPYIDREKDIGWVIWLRQIDSNGCPP